MCTLQMCVCVERVETLDSASNYYVVHGHNTHAANCIQIVQ